MGIVAYTIFERKPEVVMIEPESAIFSSSTDNPTFSLPYCIYYSMHLCRLERIALTVLLTLVSCNFFVEMFTLGKFVPMIL